MAWAVNSTSDCYSIARSTNIVESVIVVYKVIALLQKREILLFEMMNIDSCTAIPVPTVELFKSQS